MTSIPTALVREVPGSLPHALTSIKPEHPIDVARAQAQHGAYVAALEELGAKVVRLPADEAHPDCVFIEDTAIIVPGRALVTRPGAASRQGEVSAVAKALRKLLPDVGEMKAPATLDGGDVLRVGHVFFVGVSGRTNRDGVIALQEAFDLAGSRVVQLPVPDALHLKSLCSSPVPGLVLVAEDSYDPSSFRCVAGEVVVVPRAEAWAANAIGLGETVVLQAGARRTRLLLEARGLQVLEVDTSELAKADGALTCLSLLITED